MSNVVLLYYNYAQLPDARSELVAHRAVCERLGLKGRILLASEGINGTVAGTKAATDAYMAYFKTHPQLFATVFKIDTCEKIPFPRLRIKVRDEIVTLGVPVDVTRTARKLSPKQFNDLVASKDVVLFDARNNYESAIGKFAGAVTPDVKLFKDLPAALDQYEDIKDKTVITYCTGGIRCEKASALMIEKGFSDVYQLDGGIINYAQTYPDGNFEGKCFVFDERMSVAFTDTPAKLGACRICRAPASEYRDCANRSCHDLMLVCDDHATTTVVCSDACQELLAV